jgi:hydroxymethylglutaryl-CoA reductase (NADPH)
MAIHYRRIADYLRSALAGRGLDQLARLRPRHDPSRPRVPGGSALTDDAVAARWALPDLPASAREVLADSRTLEEREAYAHNIENFIGTVKIPIGLAGPLRVNGAHALGDYYVPLATTEAALVASYSRGAQLITDAGGCAAVVLN